MRDEKMADLTVDRWVVGSVDGKGWTLAAWMVLRRGGQSAAHSESKMVVLMAHKTDHTLARKMAGWTVSWRDCLSVDLMVVDWVESTALTRAVKTADC